MTLPNNTGTDIFCSSQVVVPQGGQVFIAGGDNWTGTGTTNTGNNNSNTFDYNSNTLDHAEQHEPAALVLVVDRAAERRDLHPGRLRRHRLPRDPRRERRIPSADRRRHERLDFMFPRNFIAPDGRVFGFDSNGKMYYVNTSGTGSITAAGQFSGPTGSDSSAAMFRPGKILQFGGNSNSARVIDITSGAPVVTTTLPNLSSQRRLVTATVLADGRVLATGGSDVWNEMTGVNYNAEIWNPTTGQWTRRAARGPGAPVSLDGRADAGCERAGVRRRRAGTAEQHEHGDLLSAVSLQRGGRIRDAARRSTTRRRPSTSARRSACELGGTGAISRVALIKTASVSHSWNTEQRFIELTFQQNGDQLSIQAPTKAADAPPGFYLLFVLNSAGTPSIAKIARIGVAANPNPAVTPSLVNPGNQSGQAGTPVSAAAVGHRPERRHADLQRERPAAPASPINPSTGAISGTPTAAGTFNVVVTASDGVNSDSESFVWIIGAGPPYVAEHAAAAEPGHRRQQRDLPGERDGRHRHPVPVGLRRRHAGHAVLVRLDHQRTFSRRRASTT